ncbi:hypothetical protein FB446DRAFT_814753 [Lentinula raphanica]|nr:hypothetical protein FB446DRAFT_814753 [Lentinula raphanica]
MSGGIHSGYQSKNAIDRVNQSFKAYQQTSKQLENTVHQFRQARMQLNQTIEENSSIISDNAQNTFLQHDFKVERVIDRAQQMMREQPLATFEYTQHSFGGRPSIQKKVQEGANVQEDHQGTGNANGSNDAENGNTNGSNDTENGNTNGSNDRERSDKDQQQISGSGSGNNAGDQDTGVNRTSNENQAPDETQNQPQKTGTSVSSKTSSYQKRQDQVRMNEEDIRDLVADKQESKIKLQDLLSSACRRSGLSFSKTRKLALEHAVLGHEVITVDTWHSLLREWRKSDIDSVFFPKFKAICSGHVEGIAAGFMLVPNAEYEQVCVWLRNLLSKFIDAYWAWLYWVEGREREVREKATRTIWACSEEGKKTLEGQDIEDKNVQKTFKRELKNGIQKQQDEIAAKNRILHAYARFGPIVILDPNWEHRSFKDHTLALPCQQTAFKVFDMLVESLSEEELWDRQRDGEWSLVNLACALTEGRDDANEVIEEFKLILYRLRTSSQLLDDHRSNSDVIHNNWPQPLVVAPITMPTEGRLPPANDGNPLKPGVKKRNIKSKGTEESKEIQILIDERPTEQVPTGYSSGPASSILSFINDDDPVLYQRRRSCPSSTTTMAASTVIDFGLSLYTWDYSLGCGLRPALALISCSPPLDSDASSHSPHLPISIDDDD